MRLALALAFAALAFASPARAADELAAVGNRCVIDQAHLLDPAQTRQLLDLCQQLDKAGVAQLGVATVPSLGDRSLSEYAVDFFKKWQLGHGKGRSDGVLVLAAPGTSHPWGLRVEVGYGLEGVLPDGKVGAMLDKYWVPARDRKAYGEGILHTAQAVAVAIGKDAAAGGDAAPTEESRRIAASRRGGAGEMNAGALGLAILTMLGLLLVLGSSAMRRAFPGKMTGLLALALGVVTIGGLLSMANATGGWVAFLIGLVVNGVTYASIRSHRCPKDGSWMMIEEEILEHPTYFSDGVAQVWQHCTSTACGYENTYEKVLPRKTIVVTSGGSGGGGGGPGGDSDDFGGGGGESGGGGAERD